MVDELTLFYIVCSFINSLFFIHTLPCHARHRFYFIVLTCSAVSMSLRHHISFVIILYTFLIHILMVSIIYLIDCSCYYIFVLVHVTVGYLSSIIIFTMKVYKAIRPDLSVGFWNCCAAHIL